MDFYDKLGPVALGSRLRRLSERMSEDAAQIFEIYGSELQPRWFPVAKALTYLKDATVSLIAEEIGQTHASVSQIVSSMRRNGFVNCERGEQDSRKTFVSLSTKGLAAMHHVDTQCLDVGKAVDELLSESSHDLWRALSDFETALTRRSTIDRTKSFRKQREAERLRIVDFEPHLANAFRSLNEEWIEQYFELEDIDRQQLSDPQKSIIEAGGSILIGLLEETPVGVVALIPHGENCFELAKMAVSPRAQGLGIGEKLARSAIEKAKTLGATRVYLESNSALKPAIALYQKLGFRHVKSSPSPYSRVDTYMELTL